MAQKRRTMGDSPKPPSISSPELRWIWVSAGKSNTLPEYRPSELLFFTLPHPSPYLSRSLRQLHSISLILKLRDTKVPGKFRRCLAQTTRSAVRRIIILLSDIHNASERGKPFLLFSAILPAVTSLSPPTSAPSIIEINYISLAATIPPLFASEA